MRSKDGSCIFGCMHDLIQTHLLVSESQPHIWGGRRMVRTAVSVPKGLVNKGLMLKWYRDLSTGSLVDQPAGAVRTAESTALYRAA